MKCLLQSAYKNLLLQQTPEDNLNIFYDLKHLKAGRKSYRWDGSIQGPIFPPQIFSKYQATICEIPRHCYPGKSYILRPVGIVVLTDNTSQCKEFIVTCNTKALH